MCTINKGGKPIGAVAEGPRFPPGDLTRDRDDGYAKTESERETAEGKYPAQAGGDWPLPIAIADTAAALNGPVAVRLGSFAARFAGTRIVAPSSTSDEKRERKAFETIQISDEGNSGGERRRSPLRYRTEGSSRTMKGPAKIADSPGAQPERGHLVGDGLRVKMSVNQEDLWVQGDGCKVSLATNSGLLRVTGDGCRVHIERNLGFVEYTGDGGRIVLGPESLSQERVKYHGDGGSVVFSDKTRKPASATKSKTTSVTVTKTSSATKTKTTSATITTTSTSSKRRSERSQPVVDITDTPIKTNQEGSPRRNKTVGNINTCINIIVKNKV